MNQTGKKDAHIPRIRYSGTLSGPEQSHLASCPYCQAAFWDYIEKEETIRAPGHLKASVLARSRDLDVRLASGPSRLSRKLSFLWFSLRVGTAVLCSLALLFLTPLLTAGGPGPDLAASQTAYETAGRRRAARYDEITRRAQQQYESVERFSWRLEQLPYLNREVSNYDEEEK